MIWNSKRKWAVWSVEKKDDQDERKQEMTQYKLHFTFVFHDVVVGVVLLGVNVVDYRHTLHFARCTANAFSIQASFGPGSGATCGCVA